MFSLHVSPISVYRDALFYFSKSLAVIQRKMYLVDRLFIILKGIRKSYTYVTSEQHRFDNFEVFQTIKRLD